MKNNIRNLVALTMVFTMLFSMNALAARETASKGFKLQGVLKRETQTPAEPQAPAASETPAATEAPAATQEPLTIIGKAYVVLADANSTLNVRSAASADADRLGALHHGDAVSVAGYEGDWTLIDFNGNRGYVKSSYLADKLPEAEADATVQPEPTEEPTVEPTVEPTEEPTEEPTAEPTEEPTVEPTEEPTAEPTEEPTVEPTEEPTAEPTEESEAIVESSAPSAVGAADVRIAADGLSEIFITIADGTPLTVLGVEGDWVKVEIDGQIGYIYKDSVQGVEFESPALPEDPEAEDQTKVTIFSSRCSVMSPGETVYLTSKLEGFEGYDTIVFQWQADRGNGFEDIAGATEDTYSFAADAETLNYDWRLIVMYG